MESVQKLPEDVRMTIRSFMSHPVADLLRPTINEHLDYSQNINDPVCGLNTFYMFFFSVMTLLDKLHNVFGAEVRIPEVALRPTLWPLYDREFPGYFDEQN
jgi:hypothetical protein